MKRNDLVTTFCDVSNVADSQLSPLVAFDCRDGTVNLHEVLETLGTELRDGKHDEISVLLTFKKENWNRLPVDTANEFRK